MVKLTQNRKKCQAESIHGTLLARDANKLSESKPAPQPASHTRNQEQCQSEVTTRNRRRRLVDDVRTI